MAFNKKTIRDIDFNGKRALVRADLDVPWDDEGNVVDDFRIENMLSTLNYLLEDGASMVIIGHRGRPKAVEVKTSTKKVAELLADKLGREVKFVDDCVSDEAVETARQLQPGEVLVCENLRFHAAEKKNLEDTTFAEQLSKLGDIFVQNAFSNAHRNHSSMVGITKFLPSVAGFSIENEVQQVQAAVESPQKPVLAITGGSKLETKLPLLENFMKLADQIVVAGVMANTLLVAQGHDIGKSLYDVQELPKAKEMLDLAAKKGVNFVMPTSEVAVGKSTDDTNRRDIKLSEVAADDIILDFGNDSIAQVIELIGNANTIIWNGPLGYYENPVFAKGSEEVARAIAASEARSVVGGGDTGDVVNGLGLADKFTHVSTGGGASLELLAGHTLPGVEALNEK